jgi:hypothetical protein
MRREPAFLSRIPSPPHPIGASRSGRSLIKFENGKLLPCDPDGTTVTPAALPNFANLPQNNQLVIYELPTAWTRSPRDGGIERGGGTFRDTVAMVDKTAQGANFDELEASQEGRAHIFELGINANRVAAARR